MEASALQQEQTGKTTTFLSGGVEVMTLTSEATAAAIPSGGMEAMTSCG